MSHDDGRESEEPVIDLTELREKENDTVEFYHRNFIIEDDRQRHRREGVYRYKEWDAPEKEWREVEVEGISSLFGSTKKQRAVKDKIDQAEGLTDQEDYLPPWKRSENRAITHQAIPRLARSPTEDKSEKEEDEEVNKVGYALAVDVFETYFENEETDISGWEEYRVEYERRLKPENYDPEDYDPDMPGELGRRSAVELEMINEAISVYSDTLHDDDSQTWDEKNLNILDR